MVEYMVKGEADRVRTFTLEAEDAYDFRVTLDGDTKIEEEFWPGETKVKIIVEKEKEEPNKDRY